MRRSIAFLSVVSALVATSSPSRADEPREGIAPQTSSESRPRRLLLTTGMATFLFGWSAAAYVGATSTRDTDRALLVPFGGPFVALATRDRCVGTGCGDEATYKGLMIADGAVQAAAAAQIALAFVLRETHVESTRAVEPPIARLVIVPARVAGTGAGAAFHGVF